VIKHNEKTNLIVSGLHKQPMFELIHAGLFDKIKGENFFDDIDEALQKAQSFVKV